MRIIFILLPILGCTLYACQNNFCKCETTHKSNHYYPGEKFIFVSLDFNNTVYCLNEKHLEELLNLVNDKENYLDGDCGTTFKDGTFTFSEIWEGECKVISTIKFGCNNSQLYFMPNNSRARYGRLTTEASDQLSSIILDIIK